MLYLKSYCLRTKAKTAQTGNEDEALLCIREEEQQSPAEQQSMWMSLNGWLVGAEADEALAQDTSQQPLGTWASRGGQEDRARPARLEWLLRPPSPG